MGKNRIHIALSDMGWKLLQELAADDGVGISAVIEKLVRIEFDNRFGREKRPQPRPGPVSKNA